jgi:hypothetical protein
VFLAYTTNWIESEFTALRYFTLDGSDYPSHAAKEAAIAGYVRWRNRHCHPKRHRPMTLTSQATTKVITTAPASPAPELSYETQ